MGFTKTCNHPHSPPIPPTTQNIVTTIPNDPKLPHNHPQNDHIGEMPQPAKKSYNYPEAAKILSKIAKIIIIYNKKTKLLLTTIC